MSKRFPTVLIASACFLLIVGGLVAHAFLFAAYQAGDLNYYVIPWLEQLRVEGFGKPVGNYAPPYLYLLCSHGVPIPACADGTDQSARGRLVPGGCRQRITCGRAAAEDRCRDHPLSAKRHPQHLHAGSGGYIVDGRGNHGGRRRGQRAAGADSGVERAFLRDQSSRMWIAPFTAWYLFRTRAPWTAWAAGMAAFGLAWLPAWLLGWPLSYLAGIYLGQAKWNSPHGLYVGNSASLWSFFGVVDLQLAYATWWLALPLAGLGVFGYWWRLPARLDARHLLASAAFGSTILPFLLPMMHDRFFLLGDMLATCLALAFPTRRTIAIAVLMQLASALPVLYWGLQWTGESLYVPQMALAALVLLWRELHGGGNAQASGVPSGGTNSMFPFARSHPRPSAL